MNKLSRVVIFFLNLRLPERWLLRLINGVMQHQFNQALQEFDYVARHYQLSHVTHCMRDYREQTQTLPDLAVNLDHNTIQFNITTKYWGGFDCEEPVLMRASLVPSQKDGVKPIQVPTVKLEINFNPFAYHAEHTIKNQVYANMVYYYVDALQSVCQTPKGEARDEEFRYVLKTMGLLD